MIIRKYWTCLLVLLLAGMPVLAAEPAAQTGEQLRSKVIDANKNIQAIEAASEMTMEVKRGEEVNKQNFNYRYALDRSTNKMMFEGMGIHMVIRDGVLNLKVDQIKERYLRLTGFETIDKDKLASAVPIFKGMPGLDLLMGESVIPADAKTATANDKGWPGLAYTFEGHPVEFHVNPANHIGHTTNMTATLGQGIQIKRTTSTEVKATGDQVKDELFKFDAGTAQAVDSAQALIGEPESAESLKGKAAPAFAVKDINGKDVSLKDLQAKHRVIVLDFWATWCGPCRVSLPALQKVSDWVAAGKHNAGIYTVNLQETPDKARALWSELNLKLPILMDTDGKVGSAYRAEAIPMMVVIVGDKIHNVHIGASPQLEENLKKEITQILSQNAASQ